MLIVCPSCATSYVIDPGSLGPAGRMVRCARCKTAWYTGESSAQQQVQGFVEDVIAEAEAREGGAPSNPRRTPPPQPPSSIAPPHVEDDFGAEPAAPVSGLPEISRPPAFDEPPLQAPELLPLPAAEAPPLVPIVEPVDASPDTNDIEGFAARRARMQVKRKQKRRSSRWTAIVLTLFAVNVAMVGARHEVVHYLPQTASLFAAIGLPVNLRNLAFENVRVNKEEHDGVSVLVVEGTIVSTSGKAAEVPRLRFAVRNATGQEIYSWTAQPNRSVLAPGDTLPFRSRLASPPPDSNDVLVRFFNTRDAEPGKK